MMDKENEWAKFDRIISHFVRYGQMNLAVDLGNLRNIHLELLEKGSEFEKRFLKIYEEHKVSDTCCIHADNVKLFAGDMEDLWLEITEFRKRENKENG